MMMKRYKFDGSSLSPAEYDAIEKKILEFDVIPETDLVHPRVLYLLCEESEAALVESLVSSKGFLQELED